MTLIGQRHATVYLYSTIREVHVEGHAFVHFARRYHSVADRRAQGKRHFIRLLGVASFHRSLTDELVIAFGIESHAHERLIIGDVRIQHRLGICLRTLTE